MKSKKTSPKKSKASKTAKPKMGIVAIIEERFKHHVGVIVEDSNSKFQLVLESLSTTATKEDFRTLRAENADIKSEQHIIKQVVMGHSATLKEVVAKQEEHSAILMEHSTRLDRIETKLEQKADKDDIREIKNILSNHEQRLVNLES